MGRSMVSPLGLFMQPRIPASWRICLNGPRAAVGHHVDRVQAEEVPLHGVRDLVGGLLPELHDLLVALLGLISPKAKNSSTSSTLAYLAMISLFVGGTTMSFLDTVSPTRWRSGPAP